MASCNVQTHATRLWTPATLQCTSDDNPPPIAAKAAFVKAQHPGGIMYGKRSEDSPNVPLNAVQRGLRWSTD